MKTIRPGGDPIPVDDFTHIEAKLAQESAKQKQALRTEKVRTFGAFTTSAVRMMLAGGAVVIALGAAVTAVLFGVSLTARPEPIIKEVEKIVLVDRFVPLQPTFVIDGDPLRRGALGEIMDREKERLDEQATEGATPAVLVNVSVFRHTRFTETWPWITVQMTFDDVRAERPDRQSCYVSRAVGERQSAETRVILARKDGGQDPMPEDITKQDAADADTTVELLLSAQSLCAFE